MTCCPTVLAVPTRIPVDKASPRSVHGPDLRATTPAHDHHNLVPRREKRGMRTESKSHEQKKQKKLLLRFERVRAIPRAWLFRTPSMFPRARVRHGGVARRPLPCGGLPRPVTTLDVLPEPRMFATSQNGSRIDRPPLQKTMSTPWELWSC